MLIVSFKGGWYGRDLSLAIRSSRQVLLAVRGLTLFVTFCHMKNMYSRSNNGGLARSRGAFVEGQQMRRGLVSYYSRLLDHHWCAAFFDGFR